MKWSKSSVFRQSLLLAGMLLAGVPVSCNKQAQDTSVLDYSRSAELLYLDAMDEYEDRDCINAEPKFQNVRRQFPYSRYAVEAELHIADCQFVQESYAEAAVLYEQFVAVHPTHELADYAAFRRGESFVEMIPSEVFVLPPSHERDQAAARDARTALSKFIARYPESKWRDKAVKLQNKVVDALVRHEIYVAEFYISRDDRLAAAVRLEKIRENFAESSMVPDAMFLQAMTYLRLDRKQDAKRVLNEIISYYPTHYQSKRAQEYIDMLARKGG